MITRKYPPAGALTYLPMLLVSGSQRRWKLGHVFSLASEIDGESDDTNVNRRICAWNLDVGNRNNENVDVGNRSHVNVDLGNRSHGIVDLGNRNHGFFSFYQTMCVRLTALWENIERLLFHSRLLFSFFSGECSFRFCRKRTFRRRAVDLAVTQRPLMGSRQVSSVIIQPISAEIIPEQNNEQLLWNTEEREFGDTAVETVHTYPHNDSERNASDLHIPSTEQFHEGLTTSTANLVANSAPALFSSEPLDDHNYAHTTRQQVALRAVGADDVANVRNVYSDRLNNSENYSNTPSGDDSYSDAIGNVNQNADNNSSRSSESSSDEENIVNLLH